MDEDPFHTTDVVPRISPPDSEDWSVFDATLNTENEFIATELLQDLTTYGSPQKELEKSNESLSGGEVQSDSVSLLDQSKVLHDRVVRMPVNGPGGQAAGIHSSDSEDEQTSLQFIRHGVDHSFAQSRQQVDRGTTVCDFLYLCCRCVAAAVAMFAQSAWQYYIVFQTWLLHHLRRDRTEGQQHAEPGAAAHVLLEQANALERLPATVTVRKGAANAPMVSQIGARARAGAFRPGGKAAETGAGWSSSRWEGEYREEDADLPEPELDL